MASKTQKLWPDIQMPYENWYLSTTVGAQNAIQLPNILSQNLSHIGGPFCLVLITLLPDR